MRTLILTCLLAACSTTPAEAGDLWLTIDDVEPTESVHLYLPGNWLADADEAVTIEVGDGSVDLAAEARALKKKGVGATRSWTGGGNDGDTTVTLSHERRSGPVADTLLMQTLGPKGNGLTLTMALEPDQLGQASNHLDGVLDMDGVKVELSDALCEQLKLSGPVTLLKTTGPKGGGVVLSTK